VSHSIAQNELAEHFFRHEYGGLVAMLVRRAGLHHLEAAEDAAQAALLAALTAWSVNGIPRDPSAWLHSVAWNDLLGNVRKEQRHRLILSGAESGPDEGEEPVSPAFAGEVRDELLRMLFVCCDEAIPPESRLVLALKTLCGFSIGEIAFRLFTTEANIYKRLARARQRLRLTQLPTQTTPTLDTLRSRLPSVHSIIYLLFNEGWLSTQSENAIRSELCAEAIRLGTLLASHPVGAEPATFALLALMHLHAARLASRQDPTVGLLLLEEQDRSLWDRERLQQGTIWLARAAQGDVVTRFHVEAGIAAEHCFAPSFAETRWNEIADLYATLERIDPSPIHTLNRAVAVAQGQGPQAGLAVLDGVVPPPWLDGHYLWDAVLADLHNHAGHESTAEKHRERALATAPTDAMRRLMQRRLTRPR
jgi:RNA polymerase sigma factor (sigma-70 family)